MRYRSVRRALLTLCALGVLGALAMASVTTALAASDENEVRVFRVYYETMDEIGLLQGFDLFEFNDRKLHYVLVAVHDDTDLGRLQSVGLRLELDPQQTAMLHPSQGFEGGPGIPGFPCYRTVEESYATAVQIVADHPTLAEWIDIGDSWEKENGLGGYDVMVLKLTNAEIAGPKPKLMITASIHAREYTPAELTTRFGELLVEGYGVDADLTWILDHHEVHLVLQANPDGRKQAENGLSWRKNTDQDYCGATSTSRGADLNRNWAFEWGCCNGSSGNECSNVYRGPAPASEPEVAAYQAYLRQEFPDQRGPDPTDAAPEDATGVYIDIHSFSELVLWPWGFGGTAPNAEAFTTFGRKLAFWSGYMPMQATGLYITDGTTLDFGYGDLGVASFVYELGTSFFQSCDVFENVVLPDNMPSLIYAAKVSRTPYMTPAGPDTLAPTLIGGPQLPGAVYTLSATIDSARYNNSNGVQPLHRVFGASYTIGTPPWDASATPIEMSAADGVFNSQSELVTASVDTSLLAPGRHTIFIEGRDRNGNRGAISAVFLDLLEPTADEDSDGTPNGSDCALFDGTLWSAPAAPTQLLLSDDALNWSAPADPGSIALSYELLRSPEPSDFALGECVESGILGTSTLDATTPGTGEMFSYLVRAVNGCGDGVADDSSGSPRAVVNCL